MRLIHAYGKPVGVSNAGRNRWPKSWARWSKRSSYKLLVNKLLFSEARIWAEIKPPRTLMLHCSSKRKGKKKQKRCHRKYLLELDWQQGQVRYQNSTTVLVRSNTSANCYI